MRSSIRIGHSVEAKHLGNSVETQAEQSAEGFASTGLNDRFEYLMITIEAP
jgi:hypothetical protein